MAKKRVSWAIPVALIFLVALGFGYFYLGKVAIEKTDMYLGIDQLKITITEARAGYTVSDGETLPLVTANYATNIISESYATVGEKASGTSKGMTFSKEIILGKEFFGKTVELNIIAKGSGKEAEMKINLTLPQNPEPMIIIK